MLLELLISLLIRFCILWRHKENNYKKSRLQRKAALLNLDLYKTVNKKGGLKMHGKTFLDEMEVKKVLAKGQKVVVIPEKQGLEFYGNPSRSDHDIGCLVAGARAKKLKPLVLEK